MILSLGSDVCEIARIERNIERFGERFLRRCFTPREITYCNGCDNRAGMFASRFAAKEAASKALGTGMRDGVGWQCFEIESAANGKPTLRILGRGAEIASQIGVRNVHLSISHDAGIAFAVVIFEGE